MDKDLAKEFNSISKRISSVESQLSMVMNMLNDDRKEEIESITPYTQTKTAYIEDTEIVFYNVPEGGNVTVFFDKSYNMERTANRITLTFDPLDDITDITISIL